MARGRKKFMQYFKLKNTLVFFVFFAVLLILSPFSLFSEVRAGNRNEIVNNEDNDEDEENKDQGNDEEPENEDIEETKEPKEEVPFSSNQEEVSPLESAGANEDGEEETTQAARKKQAAEENPASDPKATTSVASPSPPLANPTSNTTTSLCKIQQSSCRQNAKYQGQFVDFSDESSADLELCLKRAEAVHQWCNNDKKVTTTALFYNEKGVLLDSVSYPPSKIKNSADKK